MKRTKWWEKFLNKQIRRKESMYNERIKTEINRSLRLNNIDKQIEDLEKLNSQINTKQETRIIRTVSEGKLTYKYNTRFRKILLAEFNYKTKEVKGYKDSKKRRDNTRKSRRIRI